MKQHGRIMDLEKETGLDEKRKKEEAERYEYERRNNPNAAGQQPQPTQPTREPLLPAGNSIHETDDETDYSDLVHPGRLTQLEAGDL